MQQFSSARFFVTEMVVLLIVWALAIGAGSSSRKSAVLTGEIELTTPAGDNLVVYLDGVKGQHKPRSTVAVLDQTNAVFVPHLLPLQKGQAVIFKNSDAVTHNVHVYWGKNSVLNIVQGTGGSYAWVPPRTGQYVILCNIHTEMCAFLLVFDHSFFTIVDPKQDSKETSVAFEIGNIPEGTYMLVAVKDVSGRLVEQKNKITLRAGKTQFADIKF